MKVTVLVSEYKKVELSPREAAEIAIRTIREAYGLTDEYGKDEYALKDDKIVNWEDHGCSHTWFVPVFIRDAIPADEDAFKVIDSLKEYANRKY